jgi:Ni/Co efflux regulator RcnB
MRKILILLVSLMFTVGVFAQQPAAPKKEEPKKEQAEPKKEKKEEQKKEHKKEEKKKKRKNNVFSDSGWRTQPLLPKFFPKLVKKFLIV